MKLDENELRAVCALRGNPDFQVFLQALGAEAEKVTETLIRNEKLDSGQMYQTRGKAQAYVAIVDAIMEAPSRLENIETHREK